MVCMARASYSEIRCRTGCHRATAYGTFHIRNRRPMPRTAALPVCRPGRRLLHRSRARSGMRVRTGRSRRARLRCRRARAERYAPPSASQDPPRSGDAHFLAQYTSWIAFRISTPCASASGTPWAADESHAARTLVDDGCFHGFRHVILARRPPELINRYGHVVVEHLVARQVDRVIGSKIRIHALVELAVAAVCQAQRLVAAVVLGQLLLDDVRTIVAPSGSPARQVGRV